MSDIRNTRSYERHVEFLANIKKAKTDEDILMAGHRLLNAWHGYHSAANSDCGYRAIELIIKENNDDNNDTNKV